MSCYAKFYFLQFFVIFLFSYFLIFCFTCFFWRKIKSKILIPKIFQLNNSWRIFVGKYFAFLIKKNVFIFYTFCAQNWRKRWNFILRVTGLQEKKALIVFYTNLYCFNFKSLFKNTFSVDLEIHGKTKTKLEESSTKNRWISSCVVLKLRITRF